MSDDQNDKPQDAAAEQGQEGEAAAAGPAGHAAGDIVCEVYRIDEVTADAAGREVYEATHLDKQTRHVVWPVDAETAGSPKAMEQLVREAGLLRYLEQEAVADCEGVLHDESGRDYLVTALVEGPTLASRIAEGPLDVEAIRALRDRLGRGLMAAHEYRLVHREFSPDAVVLEDGELSKAKIVGFGLLRPATEAVTAIDSEASPDELLYIAPEQLGLYGGAVNQRTDIYSLGLVLAAAALGRALDQGKTGVQLLEDRQSPPDLGALEESLRSELEPMLQPDPKDRPSNLGDLIVAEEAASMAARLAAEADMRASSKQPSGLRGWTLIGAGVLVVIAVGLFSLQFFDGPFTRSEPAGPPAAMIEEPEETFDSAEAPLEAEPPAEEAVAQSEAPPAPEAAPVETPAETEVAESAPPAPEAEASAPAEPGETAAEESASESEEAPAEPAAAESEEAAGESESAPAETQLAADSAGEGEPAGEAVEGLLPPPDLPTSLQDIIEDATPSELVAEAEAAAEAESETGESASASESTAAESESETGTATQAADSDSSEGEEAPVQEAALPPAEAEAPAPSDAELFDGGLEDGQRRQVQRALQSLGYYGGAIDGLFGPGTRGGIAAYQRSIGEEETGFVGDGLYRRLDEIAGEPPTETAVASVAPARSLPSSTRRQPTLADAMRARQSASERDSVLGDDFEWLMRRALAGDRASQSLLASRYQRGLGAPLNLPEAVKWYRLAAEQGDARGQYNLGLMYEAGSGVQQDYDQAAAWFAKAAQQNQPGARQKLDSLYSRGLAEPPS